MIVIGIFFGVAGIGFLCWLLFSLAVYALPFFAASAAGLWAYHSDAGAIGAIVVGILAGAATLVAGQFAFAFARSHAGSALRSHSCSRRRPRSPATTRRSGSPS